MTPRERLSLLLAACTGAIDLRPLQLAACKHLNLYIKSIEPDAVAMRAAVEDGAVDFLLLVLRTHAPDARVCAEAVSALAGVAAGAWTAAKSHLAGCGAVEAALAILASHGGSHPEAALQCMRFVGNAAYGMDDGGACECKALVAAARREGEGEDEGMDAVQVSCGGAVAPGREKRMRGGGGEGEGEGEGKGAGAAPAPQSPAPSSPASRSGLHLIVAAMRAHPSHPGVARWGCHALGNCAFGRAPNALQVAAEGAGAIGAVLAALDAHAEEDVRVAVAGCEAIANLAFRHEEVGGVVARAGGAESVLRVLSRHATTEEAAARMGLFALSALPRPESESVRAEVRSAAERAIQAHGAASKRLRKWGEAAIAKVQ